MSTKVSHGNPRDGRPDGPDADPAADSHLRYNINLKQDMIKSLEAITNPGTFAAWEALPTTPPAGLHVDGVGDIVLPLGEGQIRQLIDKSHQAPFGRRSETLIDVSVRNTRQINGDQLSFLDPAWQAYLLDISKKAATSLGIDGPIQAELHKMLIYEKGAMFKILKTSDASQSFACWYSDVIHEVLPVESGYRCVLTYNLAIQPGLARPAASTLGLQKEPLRKTLTTWLRNLTSSAEHSHLYYILDHEYTQAAISPNGLKAEDYVRVQALRDLTAELPFEVFLALLEKRDEGVPLEGVSDYNENGADIAMDVSRTCHEVNSLYALDGIPIASSFGMNIDMSLEEDPFLNLNVVREELKVDTGNDGPEATHWYRRAALVMIPHKSLVNYLARCASGDGHEDRNNVLSVLSYVSKTPSFASIQEPLLDSICELYREKYDYYLCPKTIEAYLKASLQYSHRSLLETVIGSQQDKLPISFFDWANKWLKELPAADRVEMYESWIPSIIRSYSYADGRLSAIERLSGPTADAASQDEGPESETWAKALIHECETL
ncbi:hypothetical protein MJO28_001931 [Puccinia striiformis f. sp. tritici]|uniref:Uncharacterized protein n=1 Tax=Puccinia striiformis f. sp. tritici TaxID=168172 RepID=A0ACC0EVG8_9BASI|nr:hypothetical protein Pst134EA_002837 [Puccinia striiformis f. sp. tritici]KAH9464396.1 hypothetical protein Pst134EB_003923 [Puccinia striiformis f. sp. tritici]KAH9472214.1 hypothetical protein Pst134EA_002837 [Puccinia striiformis f. sp. tritici]KAI7961442.1 hypothetical protein MJO28_001931 [Puccinia striiformis f. sp. tritici]